MKYSVVCFTFNMSDKPFYIGEGKLTLRNNWTDKADSLDDLLQLLESLGNFDLQDIAFKLASEDVVKASSNFTVDNTRIIVHIVKH